jgi:hypothetical protein
VALGMFLLAVGLAWMAGLLSGVAGISPATTPLSLVIPFLVSGIGIGLAVAPVTSAVMATAPRERVGNASGVLSTMRQVGSLLGIAVLGAVLQNRVTANVGAGIEAIAGIPDAVKQKILAGIGDGGMQMGMPSGTSGMPAFAVAMMKQLFSRWFTDAVASSFVVAVALATAGGLCALALRRRAAPARVGQGELAGDGESRTVAEETA